MTRTELMSVAKLVIKNHIESYNDEMGRGTVYTGLYNKRPMSVFISTKSRIIAISYCRVCYFVNPTDRKTAPRLRSFCYDHDVTQKVFLYPEAINLIVDADGEVKDPVIKRVSGINDYEDVIPIPYCNI